MKYNGDLEFPSMFSVCSVISVRTEQRSSSQRKLIVSVVLLSAPQIVH